MVGVKLSVYLLWGGCSERHEKLTDLMVEEVSIEFAYALCLSGGLAEEINEVGGLTGHQGQSVFVIRSVIASNIGSHDYWPAGLWRFPRRTDAEAFSLGGPLVGRASGIRSAGVNLS